MGRGNACLVTDRIGDVDEDRGANGAHCHLEAHLREIVQVRDSCVDLLHYPRLRRIPRKVYREHAVAQRQRRRRREGGAAGSGWPGRPQRPRGAGRARLALDALRPLWARLACVALRSLGPTSPVSPLSPFAPLVTLAVVVPFLSVMVMVAPSAVCVTVAVGLNPPAPSKSPRRAAVSIFPATALALLAALFAAVAAAVVISVACS